MKIVSSILKFSLIAGILFNAFTVQISYFAFTINQNYIATHLCVNRDKPKMHCNGKCYMTKQLSQSADKQEQQKNFRADLSDISWITEMPVTLHIYFNEQKLFHFNNFSDLSMPLLDGIMHPPC